MRKLIFSVETHLSIFRRNQFPFHFQTNQFPFQGSPAQAPSPAPRPSPAQASHPACQPSRPSPSFWWRPAQPAPAKPAPAQPAPRPRSQQPSPRFKVWFQKKLSQNVSVKTRSKLSVKTLAPKPLTISINPKPIRELSKAVMVDDREKPASSRLALGLLYAAQATELKEFRALGLYGFRV